MKTPASITYSNGKTVCSPVICIWEDLHNERAGMFRAFWASAPDADSGSPVIGYCSAGGSQRTVRAAAREALRLYPDAKVFCNGKEVVQ